MCTANRSDDRAVATALWLQRQSYAYSVGPGSLLEWGPTNTSVQSDQHARLHLPKGDAGLIQVVDELGELQPQDLDHELSLLPLYLVPPRSLVNVREVDRPEDDARSPIDRKQQVDADVEVVQPTQTNAPVFEPEACHSLQLLRTGHKLNLLWCQLRSRSRQAFPLVNGKLPPVRAPLLQNALDAELRDVECTCYPAERPLLP